MKRLLQQLFNQRIRALIRKEFNQIRRDRRLASSLIIPPTLQLLLFGFALSAKVTNLRLGVVDDSKTPESRELIATLAESKSFRLAGYYFSINELGQAINRGALDAGVVIPYDFARDLQRGRATTVRRPRWVGPAAGRCAAHAAGGTPPRRPAGGYRAARATEGRVWTGS